MSGDLLSLAATHVWQVTLVFGVISLLGKMPYMEKRPHLMLVLWVLFFVKCLIPPVVQIPLSPMAMLTPDFTTSVFVEQSEPSALKNELAEGFPDGNANGQLIVGMATSGALDTDLAMLAVCIWIAGSAVVLTIFLINYLVVRRQILDAKTFCDDELGFETKARSMLAELGSRLGLDRDDVALVVSDHSLGPLVFGFLRPSIVFPSSMLESTTHLRPIIAHELCHVWRRDHLLGILQIAGQALFWFHPLVWIASRNVNRLCEVCCDDDAMRIFDLDSQSYAQGLVDVLSMQHALKPVAMAPGIRPFEVTKKRLTKIILNRRPRNRQSHVICIGLFLCLVIPSLTVGVGVAEPSTSSIDHSSQRPERVGANVAERRTEMDFLLGKWDVTSANGEPAGQSVFAYEKSGKMIREDWTAANGATAQGITFYDPNEGRWKMTWVDSMGTIMESSGQWRNGTLVLSGWITSKDGDRRKAQTSLAKSADGTVKLEMRVAIDGRLQPVSSSVYRPSL